MLYATLLPSAGGGTKSNIHLYVCLSSADDANRMLTIKQEAHGPQFAHLTKNS